MQSGKHALAIFIASLMILSALSGLLEVSSTVQNEGSSQSHGLDQNAFPFLNGTTPAVYNVIFSESGLPSGTSWSVTFNGTPQSSTTGSITFTAVNGTYSYTIGSVSGYTTTYTGSVTVSGSDRSVSVNWQPFTYQVTFTESGLTSGTSWTVSLDGTPQSSTTQTIVFQAQNGTHDYTVSPVSGYTTSTSTSTVTVSGAPAGVGVQWTPVQVNYTITFQESTLPTGTPWSVTLDSSTVPSTTQTVTFKKPDGNYGYTINAPAGYVASPASGTANVNGGDTSITIAFTQQKYSVTFTESGLDSGTSWTVTFNGNSQPSTSNTISFSSPDGSYSYTVGTVSGYNADPASGSGTVSGSDVSISIKFTKIQYLVTFTPNGLPSSQTWSVTFNGKTDSSTGGSIVFQEVSGTYSFSVGSVTGYQVSPSSGSITINGGDVSQAITWTPVSYTVSFTESGLNSGTSWSVTMGGNTNPTTSTVISFNAVDGSYSYSIAPVTGYTVDKQSGTVTVSGSNVNINVKWTAVQYTVTFTESGLPANTKWSVTLDGHTQALTSTSIQFSKPVGSYSYTIGDISGYSASQYSGTVTVSGSDVSVPTITWSVVKYAVTFTAYGLNPGTQWSVILSNGDQGTSSTSTLQMYEPNGSYTFVASAKDYNWLAPSGSFTVAGAPASQQVSFSQAPNKVTFKESGLPGGTQWAITVGDQTITSTTDSILFQLTDGNYNYNVGVISGYHANMYSGSFTVNGKDLTVTTVKWTKVTYTVTFTESNLPANKKWSVSFDGQSPTVNAPSDIVFTNVVNGTYTFSVSPVANYQAVPSSGSLTVSGQDVTKNIGFSQDTYLVTFTETGLPQGTSWSVNLNGTSKSSTTDTITFQEPTGNYNYIISQVTGYQASQYTGQVTVDGSPASVSIDWTLITSSVTITETGLETGTTWGVEINGELHQSSTTVIALSLAEGTYTLSVVPQKGYQIGDYSSTFTVNGTSLNIPISFTELNYTVTFTETGLDPGTSWTVTLGNEVKTSNTTQIVFTVHYGSYQFAVGQVVDYHASQYSGIVDVLGSDASVTINWNLEVYPITFSETGFDLITKFSWSISINNGEPISSRSSSFTVNEPNGTYNFLILQMTDYSISPSNGTIIIDGSGASVHVTFTRVYAVIFSESGLGPGIYWSAFIGDNVTNESISKTTQESTITFYLPDGKYFFHLGPISGYYPDKPLGIVLVDRASPEPVIIVFTQVFYTISFVQHGYPYGLEWIPTLNGVWYPSTTYYMNLSVPNGTYAFGVLPREHFSITPTSGNVTVDGNNVTINVTFVEVIFKVTFVEEGLPDGTNWSISMNGQTNLTSNKTVTFEDFNGTYFYSLGLVQGYYPMSENGTVRIDGSDTVVTIYFSITVYGVIFNETGLPPGELWYVDMGGILKSTNGNFIKYQLPNGSYNFTLSNESGYLQSIPYGIITVNGTDVLYNISFGKIYDVIFIQTGLPSGSEWSVTFNGITKSTATDRISFEAVNGSYSYTIITKASDSDYKYSISSLFVDIKSQSGTVHLNEPSNIVLSGKLTINGQGISQSVVFTKTGNTGSGISSYAAIIVTVILIAAGAIYLFRRSRNRNE